MITFKNTSGGWGGVAARHDGHAIRFVDWNPIEEYGVPSAAVGCMVCQEGLFDAFLDEMIISKEG